MMIEQLIDDRNVPTHLMTNDVYEKNLLLMLLVVGDNLDFVIYKINDQDFALIIYLIDQYKYIQLMKENQQLKIQNYHHRHYQIRNYQMTDHVYVYDGVFQVMFEDQQVIQ
jgi:hypothetical protein